MLERYEIKQQISHKAGRSTYLAEDLETNKQVVVKILEFNDLFDWDDLKLFEREAKTLKNLSHPNIPQFLDYFEIDEENRQAYALIQTYIDAPSLAEVIEQGIHFSEVEIIELAKKLLDILNYIHGLNPPVIHRDIKPSNILLTNRSGNSIGDVYLVDFGSVQTVAKKRSRNNHNRWYLWLYSPRTIYGTNYLCFGYLFSGYDSNLSGHGNSSCGIDSSDRKN